MRYNMVELESKYRQTIDSIVDSTKLEHKTIQGKPVYRSIQEAIDDIDESDGCIFIAKGVYVEKLMVNKASVTLLGESRDQTILTYDVASGTEKADGSTYGTFGSASVIVQKPNFTAFNITFENRFDFMKEYLKKDNDPTKMKNLQAVAFRTADQSDQTKLENCYFKGYQDTLLVDQGTHYFHKCVVEGAIDFIFGAGQAVFESCDIISLNLQDPIHNGFVTAASTSIDVPYGYLFDQCRLQRKSNEMPDHTVYLGRPWHPGGDPNAIASVLYYQCEVDAHIKEEGWTEMGGYSPLDARLYEYDNHGSGAVINTNRRSVPQQEAEKWRHYLHQICVR
ncbi:pectinesterase family protein [Gracilibacillus caseinilyticus]|uniref:Pectinesterase n=1 Tax=Gracilibacillus caseinilyticus TaxID=2932256 RepID=A0ABY4F0I0_9BACI|nr:pectinesterase family protein [Gracilibacillus caseinilyticus]UOQ50166.1 pectinesterase family protein [Gracilibacillus caseinilyticus]